MTPEQILDGGRWNADGTYRLDLTSDQATALRSALVELDRLRAAAVARERYEVTGVGYDFHEVELCCRCGWGAELEPRTGLAELNRRADQHTEECR